MRQTSLILVFLVVSVWGLLNYRADNFVFAWEKPVDVLIVTLVDPTTDMGKAANKYFLHHFLSRTAPPGANISGIEKWFQDEFERHTGSTARPLNITLRDPIQVESPPPHIPDAEDSFMTRWRKTSDFLGYFEQANEQRDLLTSAYDVTIYLYFYSRNRISTFQGHHPVATQRQRFGLVFVPLESRTRGFYSALVAHELCHTLGASDKYEGESCVFPHGFAEPEREPLFPQRRAEIMALGIPVAPGEERRVSTLKECLFGQATAREIGWK